MAKKYAAIVEMADRKLGLLFVKVSAELDESAFYAFLEERPANPFDLGPKGTVVSGWWFPQDQCGRVVFRPKDKKALEVAETAMPLPVTKARPEESHAMRRWRMGWQ